MQSTGLMLFWLVVVLLLIPAALWLLKRSGMVVGAPKGQALLQAVAQLNLGQGQRVVTVEVNAGGERTWLVLGVTPQQITPLHHMRAPEGPATVALGTSANEPGTGAARTLAASFAQHLRRASDHQQPS